MTDHVAPDGASPRRRPWRPGPALPGLALLGALALGTAAQAGTWSARGSFTRDDALAPFTLDLPADDVLSVRSWSYAGGINAAGQAVDSGGFAPVLALFDAQGWLLQVAHGSGSASVCSVFGSAAPASGFCWDAAFSMALAAGRYTLVLSQDGNEPPDNLLTGRFAKAGVPDYTGQDFLAQPDLHFIQVDGTPRSGHWALDISASAVPEPAGALLMLLGLAGYAGQQIARRRQTQALP